MVTEYAFETPKLEPGVAASVLYSHSLGANEDTAPARGHRGDGNRLQKLDKPTSTMGCRMSG